MEKKKGGKKKGNYPKICFITSENNPRTSWNNKKPVKESELKRFEKTVGRNAL